MSIALVSVSSLVNGQNPLIAKYLFSTNNADSSGRVIIAENYGATYTTDRLGAGNCAMSFDGSGSYLNIPVHNLPLSNSPRSMSIWFKTNYYGADYRCMIAYGSAAGGKPIFPIFLRYGKVFYESGSGSDALYSKTEVTDNNWHMATVTYNGGKVILYVDGVANDSVSTTIVTDPSAVWVGKCVWENRFGFSGSLDEPSIYNRALTKTEVEQLYSENIPTDGLIAHYSLNNNLENSQPIRANFERVKYTNDRFGNLNNAIQFEGNSNSYINFNTPELPLNDAPRSISLWFKTSVKPSETIVVWGYGQAVAGAPIFTIMLNTEGKLYFESGWGNNPLYSKVTVYDNRWHHAVYTYDSDTVRMYLDGAIQDSVAVKLQTQSSTVVAGKCIWSGANAFNGSIDDILFYNKSINASQVDSLFKIGGMDVYQDLPVSEVIINNPNQTIVAGNQLQLSAQILPINTINQKKIWESSNSEIAQVDAEGIVKTFWNKSGSVMIICKSYSDNTKTDTLHLTINAQIASPDSGLVAYYPLNGTTTDMGPYANNGDAYNGVSFGLDRFGNNSGAAYFDGVDDYIQANIDMGTFSNDWTISAWFNKKQNVTWSGIVSNNVGVYSCPLITSINNTNNIGINNSGVNETNVSANIGTSYFDKWVFSTISYSKQNNKITMVVYAPDSTYRIVAEIPWKLKFTDKIYIGRHFSGGMQIHKGAISDVRLYNRNLNETEIDSLYRRDGWLPYTNVPVTSVEIKTPDQAIDAGKKITAQAFVYPANTTNRGVIWKSLDESKATVDANGIISTNWKESGEVKIVCLAASDNTKTDTLKITINELTTDLENGLLMYYPFNGNADDESGFTNNGIVKGAKLTYDRFGLPDKAYNFDGNDQIIVESSNHPTGKVNITYCFWFMSKTDNTGKVLINAGENTSNKRSGVVVSNGGTLFYVAHYNDCGFNTPQPINKWVFVTMQKNNDTLTLYINGTYAGINKINPGQNLTSTRFCIGGNGSNWYGGEFFNGFIDDIRVYSRNLNEKEIDSLYHENGWAGYQDIDPSEVKITNAETSIVAGNRLQMNAIALPSNTTKNQHWWKSLNSDIATIDSLSGKLTSFNGKTGNVDIVCKMNDYEISDTLRLTVKSEPLNLDSLLVYHLKLNGNSSDTSGNNFNGIIHGATSVQNMDGENNKAYEFNGIDQYIEMPAEATTDLQEFTFSCWIKTTESRSNGTYWNRPCIFGNSTPSSPDADFGIITNNGYIGIWSGLNAPSDNETVSTTKINDNQWHLISCTYNGDSLKLYVDGADINCNLKAIQRLNAYGYWIMAQHYYSGGANFYHQGTIDEVRLYSRALYPSEIAELYNSPNTGIITNNANNPSIELFPNPASNYIMVKHDDGELMDITINDINGRTVKQLRNVNSNERIDISTVQNGLYIVTLRTAKEVISTKFLKN